MKKTGIKKGDILILAAVLCLAALSFLCINLFSSPGNMVEIKVNNKVVKQMALDEDFVFDVEQDGIKTNTIKAENGKVSVTYANCPDLICQHHKEISNTGESIVCLPNKVVVSIVGGDDEVDGVAG